MNPYRLAWRSVCRGHRRNMAAVAVSALAVCALDVLAGRDIAARAGQLAFDAMSYLGLAVIATAIAATTHGNARARRIEVATLRALGMRASAVFMMYTSEAVWIACIGVVAGAACSGPAAWGINRLALLRQAGDGPPELVALDGARMLTVAVSALAVTLLAALVPAFMAARADFAPSSA